MRKDMRRKDRMLSEADAWEIAGQGKYGVLSLMGEDGCPYGVPLHYAVDGKRLYFHGTAAGGQKTDCMAGNDKASFTIVKTENGIQARSAILFGRMADTPALRERVLSMFVEKYVPQCAWEQAKAGIPLARDTIQAFCLDVESITGKWIDKPTGK